MTAKPQWKEQTRKVAHCMLMFKLLSAPRRNAFLSLRQQNRSGGSDEGTRQNISGNVGHPLNYDPLPPPSPSFPVPSLPSDPPHIFSPFSIKRKSGDAGRSESEMNIHPRAAVKGNERANTTRIVHATRGLNNTVGSSGGANIDGAGAIDQRGLGSASIAAAARRRS